MPYFFVSSKLKTLRFVVLQFFLSFMETNPTYYNLSKRIQLQELGEYRIGIRKVIKSRIIHKDALKIIEIANQIRNIDADLNIILICTSNICSKSKTLLASEGIGIQILD